MFSILIILAAMFESIKYTPIITLLYLCTYCQNKHPGRLFREEWGNHLMSIQLINMTINMCKDAMYKLRMVEKIQEEYKNTLSYELGLLASGIMDRFKHMIRIYRYYSNHTKYKKEWHSVTEVMNAYSVMQSSYNEIRAERELYLQVLEQERLRKEKEDREIAEYAARNPGMSPKAIKDARDRGIELPNATGKGGRRAMDAVDTTRPDTGKLVSEDKGLIIRVPGPKNATDWSKKNKNSEEAAYKKKLRYIMWAERWNGYNPEIEGVDVPDLAKFGFANASNFLSKNLKGNM